MGKNIILGITGGIAAYKMATVASRLTQQGHNVFTVMTEAARQFISPLTFRSITGNPVETDLFSPPEHHFVKHISLADRADLLVIAPATANIIGKMASGIADNLLSTLLLAVDVPVIMAPAMNSKMYNNQAVRDNIKYLKENGIIFIEPASGYLACGVTGKGRLPEPEKIIEYILKELTPDIFHDKRILITAGPTREALDCVRYFSNYSSGKMGYALARAAAFQGGRVTLVSGPCQLDRPIDVELIKVETALAMQKEVRARASDFDFIIMAAAVADFRPAVKNKDKLKKEKKNELIIKMKTNPDILKELGENKGDYQKLIGFAAESSNIVENARQKLVKKNLDIIIANDISSAESGFAVDNNEVIVVFKDGQLKLPLMPKKELAFLILEEIMKKSSK